MGEDHKDNPQNFDKIICEITLLSKQCSLNPPALLSD
jgi:hypothetical protein